MSDPLSSERIELATQTLAALDDLQAADYIKNHEQEIRKKHPHAEATALMLAHQTIRRFTMRAPGCNAQGIRMHGSVFVNGLRLMELNEEAETAVKALEKL